MSNDKKEQASRNPFAEMLEEIQEDNELRKEASNLDNQIERLKKATKEVNDACESLDTKMASARSYGVTVGKAISLALDRVDSFDTKLDGLKAFKFTAVLDNQSLEQIKAEQEALKGEYKKNLNEHKKMLNQLLEFEKSILSNHREELKKITREQSVWLSFKAWVWAIIVFELLLVVVGVVVFFCARAKFT